MNIIILKLDNLKNFETYTKYLELISVERQLKIKSLKFQHKKMVSLFSELLIRFQISNELNIPNDNIFFEYNRYGKPHLKGMLNYHFSISHSNECIAFVSDTNPIGVDIEKIKLANLKLAKRFFTSNEYVHIINSQNANQEFFKVWTLKEAYIKMLGLGLSKPLNSFDVFKLNEFSYNTSIQDFEVSIFCSKGYPNVSTSFVNENDLLLWASKTLDT